VDLILTSNNRYTLSALITTAFYSVAVLAQSVE